MTITLSRKNPRIFSLALSAILACALTTASLTAFADDAPNEPATDDAPAQTESTAGETPIQTQVDPSSPYGLHAAANATVNSNATPIVTTADGACGLYAETGSTIIANALTVQTTGSRAIAVATSPEGGAVSIMNSQIETSGTDSPLLQSSGKIEADNVTGAAAKSQIARVEGTGQLIVDSSTLVSDSSEAASDETMPSAITIYSANQDGTATISTRKAALLQASDSQLESAIQSGAFFHLVNTEASIVLFDNDLVFDSDKAKLLVAAGSDATSSLVSTTTSKASEFGTAGKNGVTATFTAIDQDLDGDIEVDSISSLDFYLLEGSTWTGSANITANPAGADQATNIVVNVDATSGWIVTENSTVSRLNIEKGGKLVDESGKAVTIVDADGNKLVDGASSIEVSVADEFSTTVKTTSENALQSATIDRTAFDAEFGTSTTFGTNGATVLSDEETAAALQMAIIEWFHNL